VPTPLLDNRQLGTDTARLNLLVNGGFEIWQRGNGPFTAANAYSADRWFFNMGAGDTVSVSRVAQNSLLGSAYAAGITYTKSTGPGQYAHVFRAESGLVGLTITMSAVVYSAVPNAVRLTIQDDAVTAFGAYHTGNSTYQTLSVTKTIVLNATFVTAAIRFDASGGPFYVDNAMMVVGSQAADYAPLHPADDLARCMRYYEVLVEGNNGAFTFTGYQGAGGGFYTYLPLKVTKGGSSTITVGGTWITSNCGTPTVPGYASNRGIRLDATATAAGYAFFQPGASPVNFVTSEWNP